MSPRKLSDACLKAATEREPRGNWDRHWLVWLDGDLETPVPDSEARPEKARIAAWLGEGLPAVVRRRAAGDPADCIPLGICLPFEERRGRLAFSARPETVRRLTPPLPLSQACTSAPPAWRTQLAELDAMLVRSGLRPRVYGSLAWQALTGHAYMSTRSDIDLLLRPADLGEMHAALELVPAWEQRTGLRADGEFLLPGGAAIAWRELLPSPQQVLVKMLTGVALWPLSQVHALLSSQR